MTFKIIPPSYFLRLLALHSDFLPHNWLIMLCLFALPRLKACSFFIEESENAYSQQQWNRHLNTGTFTLCLFSGVLTKYLAFCLVSISCTHRMQELIGCLVPCSLLWLHAGFFCELLRDDGVSHASSFTLTLVSRVICMIGPVRYFHFY